MTAQQKGLEWSEQDTRHELPEGWVWTRLENCIEVLDKHRIPINAEERRKRIVNKSTSELNPCYGATGQVGWIDDYLFDEELVLLGEDGAPFFESTKNKAYLIKGKSWVNNHTHILKSISNIALNQFLCHYLNIFDYHGHVTGTTRFKLNQSSMRKIPFPIPPRPEQRAIVSKVEQLFSDLDNGIDNFKKAQEQLKIYHQAVLKNACEGKLVPTEAELACADGRDYEPADVLLARILEERREKWEADLLAKGKDPKKAKYVEPQPPNIEGMPHLPESWMWVSWEAILAYEAGAFKRGPFGSSLTKFIFVESGYKVCEQYCPINDDCSFGRYCITPEKFEELKTFEVIAGDYLVSCSGVTLGRITRVPQEYERGIISHPYFLYLFRSPLFQKLLFDNSTGTAIPNVRGVKELKAISIPFPPLAEQHRIVTEVERRLLVSDKMEETIAESLQKSDALRQSILKKAFEGKLLSEKELEEARNAPDWKPAEKLLERIKAEKTNTKRKNKGKK
ncbi:MAG: restriction endonuclease subunit S [Euryarchaeota archaeon]|nr:restriction endonuclease subunit S [Euryarchaeota archaeon]